MEAQIEGHFAANAHAVQHHPPLVDGVGAQDRLDRLRHEAGLVALPAVLALRQRRQQDHVVVVAVILPGVAQFLHVVLADLAGGVQPHHQGVRDGRIVFLRDVDVIGVIAAGAGALEQAGLRLAVLLGAPVWPTPVAAVSPARRRAARPAWRPAGSPSCRRPCAPRRASPRSPAAAGPSGRGSGRGPRSAACRAVGRAAAGSRSS